MNWTILPKNDATVIAIRHHYHSLIMIGVITIVILEIRFVFFHCKNGIYDQKMMKK